MSNCFTIAVRVSLLCGLLLVQVGVQAQQTVTPSPYTCGTASAEGTGRFYLDREIAPVMGHRGAAWLERAERARTERPDLVVEHLELKSTDVVADIGAGTGYFTFRLASQVPRGRVLAVDVQPEMLAIIEQRARNEGIQNVDVVRGRPTAPGLGDGVADVVLLVDAYHEFSHPREMAQGIFRALRPGGRVVLVEYRAEDPDVPIKPLHTMTERQARRELEANGFRFVENRRILPQQHYLVFERPE